MPQINDAGIIAAGIGGYGVTLYQSGTSTLLRAGAGLGGFNGPTSVLYQGGAALWAYDWTTSLETQADTSGANIVIADPSGFWAAVLTSGKVTTRFSTGFRIDNRHPFDASDGTVLLADWSNTFLELRAFDGTLLSAVQTGGHFGACHWWGASLGWLSTRDGRLYVESVVTPTPMAIPPAANLGALTIAGTRYLIWPGPDGYAYAQTIHRPDGDLIARFGGPVSYYPSMNANLMATWSGGGGDAPVFSRQLTSAEFVPLGALPPIQVPDDPVPTFQANNSLRYVMDVDGPNPAWNVE